MVGKEEADGEETMKKEGKKPFSVFAYPEKNDLLWFHPEGFFFFFFKKRSFSLFLFNN